MANASTNNTAKLGSIWQKTSKCVCVRARSCARGNIFKKISTPVNSLLLGDCYRVSEREAVFASREALGMVLDSSIPRI